MDPFRAAYGLVSGLTRRSAFAGSPVSRLTVSGSRNLQPEELLAFEFGYRTRPADRLFLDLATFYNLYTHLRTVEP